MRVGIFYPNGDFERVVVTAGVLCIVERDMQPLDAKTFRFNRDYSHAIVRSDEPGAFCDLLGLPRNEPGIEPL